MPFIKADVSNAAAGPHIPACMRLPPDEQEQHAQVLRTQLLGALQPTPDMVEQVTKDANLMAGERAQCICSECQLPLLQSLNLCMAAAVS